MALIPDGQTLLIYMDKYCRENPLKGPMEGGMQLFLELKKHSAG